MPGIPHNNLFLAYFLLPMVHGYTAIEHSLTGINAIMLKHAKLPTKACVLLSRLSVVARVRRPRTAGRLRSSPTNSFESDRGRARDKVLWKASLILVRARPQCDRR